MFATASPPAIDLSITNPQHGQTLVYDATTKHFKNADSAVLDPPVVLTISNAGEPFEGLSEPIIAESEPPFVQLKLIEVESGDQLTIRGKDSSVVLGLPSIHEGVSTNFPSSINVDEQGRVTSVGEASANLAGIDALDSTGMVARLDAGTFVIREIKGTASEIEVSNGDGVEGDPTIGLADVTTAGSTSFPSSITVDAKGRVTALGGTSNNLAGLDSLSTTGIVLRGDAAFFETREIKGTVDEITVSNGDGVNGDPTIELATIGESASVNYPVSVDIDNKGRVTALGEGSANLAGIDGLSTTGIAARTGSGTFATRSIAGTVDEITVSNGDGVSGNPTIGLATIGESASVNYPVSVDIDNKGRVTALGEGSANLAGLDALNTTGIAARTGSGTFATRSITGTADEIDVTDGDGVSGNPTIGLADVTSAGSTNFPSSITVDAKGRVTSVGATADDLSAIEALNSTGLAVRTAANTWATRAITLENICLKLTNGSGVAGNIAIGFRTLLCASLSKSGAQSINSNDSTTIANQTQITSWTDSDDYSINNFGEVFDTTNGEFEVIAGAEGLYEIKFMAQWSFNAVNTWQTRIYIVHNTGSSDVGLAFDFRQDNSAAPSNVYQNMSWMGYLGSGKIKFLAGHYNSSGQSRSFNSGRVCITRLSYGLD